MSSFFKWTRDKLRKFGFKSSHTHTHAYIYVCVYENLYHNPFITFYLLVSISIVLIYIFILILSVRLPLSFYIYTHIHLPKIGRMANSSYTLFHDSCICWSKKSSTVLGLSKWTSLPIISRTDSMRDMSGDWVCQ